MQHRVGSGQAALEAITQLGGEADLRHQDQGLTASCNGRLDQPDVDLGLTAAGHSVEQEGHKAPIRRLDHGHRARLLRIQVWPGRIVNWR